MTEMASNSSASRSTPSEKKENFYSFMPISRNLQVIFLFLLLSIIPFTFYVSHRQPKNNKNVRFLTTYSASDNVTKASILRVNPPQIKTVFVIVMENTNWSDIKASSSAPYINDFLLPNASYATNYFTPVHNHPSEANYIWMEAGTNLGISTNDPPDVNHQSTGNHLSAQLDNAGILWKSYQEGITGDGCPLTGSNLYAPKHNPMVFFDDVTDNNNSESVNCMIHIRPYTELSRDLQQNRIGSYNFITPNLCNDMHNETGCKTPDRIKNGDHWLKTNIPQIFTSKAFRSGGALFITWDEGTKDNSDGPIGMIALSPYAKGNGYASPVKYTHSSLLRTIQEIFNVSPFLGDAENASDLRDMFISIAVTPAPTQSLTQLKTSTAGATSPPIPTPTLLSQPTDTPEVISNPDQENIQDASSNWLPYTSGSTISGSGFSFTYPDSWKVSFKQKTLPELAPMDFLIDDKNGNAQLSIGIYPKTATVQEFITTNFPQFYNKLTISSHGYLGNKTIYQISPNKDVASNDLVNFEFGTHGIVIGSGHTYDIGFTGGDRSVIDNIEKNIWSRFHFQ